ncbi:glycosyltransferase [Agrococcus sp. SGAir0287]|uniref:glycosyltransferase n=1 Tax=Agrococcus sp. SGAir0287 TaxID=2070347 RepID=UPI0010CCB74D|nr:glycosyltransferase [Agrococcus sp. SGAir0287]QCR19210.1 dolichol-phosphate mannosyltransferase [Agrococcus sp. SGAir0287]
MPSVLVVVPTYDEIDSLERTIGRLRQSVPHARVLVVDDASTDGTGELADRLAADDPSIEVLHRTVRGYGSAVREGLRAGIAAGVDAVAVTDADGSYDLTLLGEMLEAIEEDVDLVIASRWVPGGDVRAMAGRRRVLSQAGNRYARTLLGTDVQDLTSTFRVYSTRVLRRMPLDRIRSDSIAFQIELAVRVAQAGGRIVEMPVQFTERAVGVSKTDVGMVVDTLRRVTAWSVHGIRARPRRQR